MSIDSLVTKYANMQALYAKAEGRGWQPSAVEEFAKGWAEQFDSNQRHRSTGASMEATIADYERERPHLFVVDAHDAADFQLQLAACGPNRTLTAMGALRKSCADQDQYLWILQSWNCSPNDLKPGTPPVSLQVAQQGPKAQENVERLKKELATAEAALQSLAPKPKGDHASNPWSKAGFNVTAQGRLVRDLGAERAAAIARSVGCTLGSTKPNPNY